MLKGASVLMAKAKTLLKYTSALGLAILVKKPCKSRVNLDLDNDARIGEAEVDQEI